MLKFLGSLAFNGANPLTKVFTFLKLLAVLLVVGAIGYAVYSTYDAFASKRESKVIIDAQKQEISNKNGVIADQTNQAGKTAEVKKIEDEVIIKLDKSQNKNKQKTEDLIQQMGEKITSIAENPDFTPEEKSNAVAQVSIDTVWTAYCGTAGVSSSGCSADTGSTTTPTTPISPAAATATS